MHRHVFFILAALLVSGCARDRDAARPPQRLPLHTIRVGPVEARVAVAATPEERNRGLQGRVNLAADEGMLFVFASPRQVSFWMKDTPTALSIAFVTPDGRIAEIQEMAPETTETHVSRESALMALEMPAGWFGKSGVKVGDRIAVPDDAIPSEVR